MAGVDGGPGGAEAMMINLQWNVIAEPGSYFFRMKSNRSILKNFLMLIHGKLIRWLNNSLCLGNDKIIQVSNNKNIRFEDLSKCDR